VAGGTLPSPMKRAAIPCLHLGDIELPTEVSRLYDLAYNLWWTWTPEARRLFASIDPAAWSHYRNPVQMLINVEPERWRVLVESEPFMDAFGQVMGDFDRYLDGVGESWFYQQHGATLPGAGGRSDEGGERTIAYFSMEYGLDACLALYSGGLGVLSGDHLKSASDLGLPFVAVGLLYPHGYFRQTVDAEGWQQHSYPQYDLTRLPLRPVATRTGRSLVIPVPVEDRDIHAQVWLAQVGRVPLLLLDTDIPENDPADRPITDILYVQGREMRLVQEMLLGVGGARALRALEITPTVWHLNEGHCAFAQLERLDGLRRAGQTLDEALAALRATTAFTTHTPVPAGNEQFDRALAVRYLEPWGTRLDCPVERLMALGNSGGTGEAQPLNLTALALRTSGPVNGVSQLNAEVLERMWQPLLAEGLDGSGEPGPPRHIRGITNGVHSATWLGLDMRRLLERHLGRDWQDKLLEPAAWSVLEDVPDGEVWKAHQAQKARLGRFCRGRLREQLARHGQAPSALREVEAMFDPEVLTLGFARRFATYKRANLIFTDLERLQRALRDGPVQILFAGKAHPADRPGQELIQNIFQLSQSPELKGRVFFLEDYDMRVGAMLVQGVDVWLNTPRRPLEASGTSGQKASLNGALNFSVLDGWWPEGFDGENGWAIGEAQRFDNEAEQDRDDAASFYRTLEEAVIPLYREREDGLPRRWIEHMKRAIATVAPQFSAHRMVRDYVELAYAPAPGARQPEEEAIVGQR
jgi:glycogen phosphorylase